MNNFVVLATHEEAVLPESVSIAKQHFIFQDSGVFKMKYFLKFNYFPQIFDL